MKRHIYTFIGFLAIGLFLFPLGSKADTTSGLVGWWTLDWANLQKSVLDSSGLGNNGYLVGFTSTSSAMVKGQIGQGLKFNGTSQYALMSSAGLSATSFTYSAWINITAYPSGAYPAIVHNDVSSTEPQGLYMESATNGIALVVGIGNYGTAVWRITKASVPVNQWHLITATANGTTYAMYLDGKPAGGTYSDSLYKDAYFYYAIGRGNNYFFNGSVDDARIYSRALSAQDVYQLYQTTAYNYITPRGY